MTQIFQWSQSRTSLKEEKKINGPLPSFANGLKIFPLRLESLIPRGRPNEAIVNEQHDKTMSRGGERYQQLDGRSARKPPKKRQKASFFLATLMLGLEKMRGST